MINVLVVSEDERIWFAVREALASEAVHSIRARTLDVALAELAEAHIPLIFAPVRLAGIEARELCDHLRATPGSAAARIVALPEFAVFSKRQALDSGFDDVLYAPFDSAALRLLVQSVERLEQSAGEIVKLRQNVATSRRLAHDLASSTSLAQQARFALDAVLKALPSTRGAIWIRERDAQMIRCVAQSGLSTDYIVRGSALFNYLSPAQWTDLTNHPQCIPNARAASGALSEIANDEDFDGSLTLALFSSIRIIGALTLYFDADDAPGMETINALETLAANAALAFDQTLIRVALESTEATYRRQIESMPYGVFALDSHGNFMLSNAALENICGYSAEAMKLISIFDVLDNGQDGDSGKQVSAELARIAHAASPGSEGEQQMDRPIRASIMQADKNVIQAEIYLNSLKSQHPIDDIWIQGVMRDISAEARQQTERQVLRDIIHTASTIADGQQCLTRIVELGASRFLFESMIVWTLAADTQQLLVRAQTGHSASDTTLVRSQLAERVLESGELVCLPDAPALQASAQQIGVPISQDGRVIGVLQVESPRIPESVEPETDFLQAIAAQISMVLDRCDLQQKIAHQAMTDSITGLPNRVAFQHLLEEAIANTSDERQVSVLVIGIDRFKSLNDIYGHHVADDLLRQIGAAVQQHLETPNTVARFASDEFAVLLPDSGRQAVFAIAEALRITIATRLFMVDDQLEQVTASIGAATYPDDAGNPTRLVLAANHATHLAKQAGRNQVYQSNAAFAELAAQHGRLADLLQRTPRETLALLVKGMDQRLPDRLGHAQRVTSYAVAIGRQLGLPNDHLNALRIAGYVHDVGMISLPDALLRKPVRLSEAERNILNNIPATARHVLSQIALPSPVLPAVVHQHEHWDGSGLPMQLAGADIPLEARIIAVSDALDALTSERAHRESVSLQSALDLLARSAGTQFDPDVVEAAKACFADPNAILEPASESSRNPLLLVAD